MEFERSDQIGFALQRSGSYSATPAEPACMGYRAWRDTADDIRSLPSCRVTVPHLKMSLTTDVHRALNKM